MKKNELDDLKGVIDNMLVQTTILSVTQQTMISMILGVYRETLPEENALKIAGNFFDILEKNLLDAFQHLDDVLYDEGTLLMRQKMEFLEWMRGLRNTFC